jgi:Leucine-rich repeat (LRR) protein
MPLTITTSNFSTSSDKSRSTAERAGRVAVGARGAAVEGDDERRTQPAEQRDEDNLRILRRVEAAVGDPTGRLRLLVDSTNATSLPGFEIAQLRGTLRELDCSNSPYLRSLPMEIGHLYRTLTTLHCRNCVISALPDEVGLLTHLTELDCSGNRLDTFLWDCRALLSLRRVDLSRNRLRFLSPSAAQTLLLKDVDTNLTGNEATLRAIAANGTVAAADVLPPNVNNCSVCADEGRGGGAVAHVYVQFLPWHRSAHQSGLGYSGASTPTAGAGAAGFGYGGTTPGSSHGSGGGGGGVRVPVVHPCCSPECATAVYRWQSLVHQPSPSGV